MPLGFLHGCAGGRRFLLGFDFSETGDDADAADEVLFGDTIVASETLRTLFLSTGWPLLESLCKSVIEGQY